MNRPGSTLVVDAGDSLSVKQRHADLAAAQVKAEVVAEGWSRDPLHAIALSARDWTLGAAFVRDLVARHDLPVVAANLTCGGEAPFPATRSVTVDGRTVVFVGITLGAVEGCEVSDPGPALAAALEGTRADVTVALLPLDRKGLMDLGPIPADIAIVADATTRLDMGPTLPLAPMARGKKLGIASLTMVEGASGVWSASRQRTLTDDVKRLEGRVEVAEVAAKGAGDDPGNRRSAQLDFHRGRLAEAREALAAYGDGTGKHRVSFEERDLDDTVADAEDVRALVDAGLERLEEGKAIARTDAPRTIPAGPYVGASACATCHPDQQKDWASTPHADAYGALIDDKHGADPSCVGCHVLGWQQAGGPAAVEAIAGFRDVQCEACHGPGRAHVGDPAAHDMKPGSDLGTCQGCHDGEQDGGRFDPKAYLERIDHAP